MQLWPVEHFWLTFFQISADQKWAKGVQLVRVAFFRGDLQNPYLVKISSIILVSSFSQKSESNHP